MTKDLRLDFGRGGGWGEFVIVSVYFLPPPPLHKRDPLTPFTKN
jgi:hypothetical protein